jgi:hypothetical protein
MPPTVAACSISPPTSASKWDHGGYYRRAKEAKRPRVSRRLPNSPVSLSSSSSSNVLPCVYPCSPAQASMNQHSPDSASVRSVSAPFDEIRPSPLRRSNTPDRQQVRGGLSRSPDRVQWHDYDWRSPDPVMDSPLDTPGREDYYRREGVAFSTYEHGNAPYSGASYHQDDQLYSPYAASPQTPLYREEQYPPTRGRLHQTARRPPTIRDSQSQPYSRSPSISPGQEDYRGVTDYGRLHSSYQSSGSMPVCPPQHRSVNRSDEPLFRYGPQKLSGYDDAEPRMPSESYGGFNRRRVTEFDELGDLRSILQDGLGMIRRDIALGAARSHVNSEFYQAEMIARHDLVSSMVAHGNKRHRDLESLQNFYPGYR